MSGSFTHANLPSVGKRVLRMGIAGNYGLQTADIRHAAERGVGCAPARLAPEDFVEGLDLVVLRAFVRGLLGGELFEHGEVTRNRVAGSNGGRRHDRLVTLHPCGQSWIGEDFRHEPWFDFIGYQSGHGDGDDHLRWLVEGPPARGWSATPPKPAPPTTRSASW